jgi:hypothetical protein
MAGSNLDSSLYGNPERQLQFEFNAEGVGKFQPRVCFETLGA